MTALPSAPSPLNADPLFAAARATSTLPRPAAMATAVAGVMLAHAGLVGVFLFTPVDAEPVAPPRPLMVSVIEPEPAQRAPQSASQATPPAPTVAAPKPVVRKSVLAPQPLAEPQPATVNTPIIATPVPTQPFEAPAQALPASPPAQAATAESVPPLLAPTAPYPADYLSNPKPPYPPLSRRMREEGTVRLNVLVNPDGSVARLELAQSSGFPRLDRSALETVQSHWKFEPARQGSNPVAAWVVVPIKFSLRS